MLLPLLSSLLSDLPLSELRLLPPSPREARSSSPSIGRREEQCSEETTVSSVGARRRGDGGREQLQTTHSKRGELGRSKTGATATKAIDLLKPWVGSAALAGSARAALGGGVECALLHTTRGGAQLAVKSERWHSSAVAQLIIATVPCGAACEVKCTLLPPPAPPRCSHESATARGQQQPHAHARREGRGTRGEAEPNAARALEAVGVGSLAHSTARRGSVVTKQAECRGAISHSHSIHTLSHHSTRRCCILTTVVHCIHCLGRSGTPSLCLRHCIASLG